MIRLARNGWKFQRRGNFPVSQEWLETGKELGRPIPAPYHRPAVYIADVWVGISFRTFSTNAEKSLGIFARVALSGTRSMVETIAPSRINFSILFSTST